MFERKFTLRHVIKNFPELKEEDGPLEEHFGVPWRIVATHNEKWFSLYLRCLKEQDEALPWSVDVNYQFRVVSVTGKGQRSEMEPHEFTKTKGRGWPEFCTWDDIIQNHMVDDTVIVECDVNIKRMTGIAQKRKIDFRGSQDLTDVVLKAGDEKFNVSKVFLSTLSPYFKKLFFGNSTESKELEVVLDDVDPESFQSFLEEIHGKSSITSDNVESLLKLADRFVVETIRNRCEEFLFHCEHISNKNKFRIADSYGLTALQNHCLKEVKTSEDVRALLPADVTSFSHATLATLLQKTFSPT